MTSLCADLPTDPSELQAENDKLQAEIDRLQRIIATSGIRRAPGNPRNESSEAYYSAFFENSPNDLFVLEVCPDGRFVFEQVNPMVTKSTGYTRDMLIGKTGRSDITAARICTPSAAEARARRPERERDQHRKYVAQRSGGHDSGRARSHTHGAKRTRRSGPA